MAKSLKRDRRPSATLSELDALILQAEAAGVERTPIGYVANIRGRLSRDERSRFWRAPGAGSWDLRGAPLSQGEIVAAVHALRWALDRQAEAGGQRARARGRGRRGGGIIDAAGPISPRDYPGLFQDTNRDGIPDVDDPNPTGPPGKVSVEETRLSDELASVIALRSQWQAALPRFRAALAQVAHAQGTPQAKVLARVKTPYSVVNKLLRKRLKTLTDTTGGMLIVQTATEVRRLDAAIGAGALGRIIERVDFYKTPNAGYRAIHYIVDFPGIGPAEVQLKTVRLKVVQSVTHTAYKQGRLSAEGSEQLYSLAAAADEGDSAAAAAFGALTQVQMGAIARGEGGLAARGLAVMRGRAAWSSATAWHATRGRDRYGRVSIRGDDDDRDKLFGEAW